jgi:integrating conjugative element membrane protein (TIGR03745 family)
MKTLLAAVRTKLARVRAHSAQLAARLTVALTAMVLGTRSAFAALPVQKAPANNPGAGDWLGLIQGYLKDGFTVLALALGAGAFLWLAWGLIAKFNEARTGKAEWGTVGLYAVGAGGVAVLDVYLLNTAVTIL